MPELMSGSSDRWMGQLAMGRRAEGKAGVNDGEAAESDWVGQLVA